ncbi:MAG: hypothetical protein CM15mP120_20660 [Pseudomonadota bacterium]|nr:MAG: hypothetical protein CM15mP120_20660 [Pseudomonadota bacterium]
MPVTTTSSINFASGTFERFATAKAPIGCINNVISGKALAQASNRSLSAYPLEQPGPLFDSHHASTNPDHLSALPPQILK